MSLRVAIVALYPAPGARSAGGVRAVVQNLVGALRHWADLQLCVLHCHADVDRDMVVEEGNLRVEYMAMPRRRVVPNSLMSILRVEGALRRLQPDVVNAHAAHYALAALRMGIPTALTIHGVVRREAEIYRHTWFDRTRFGLEKWLEGLVLPRVSDIVAISDYVVAEYAERTRARFHRINNPLPSELYAINDEGESGHLLYAGTIDERKNVLELVRAVAMVRDRVPEVRLTIAGRTTQPDYEARVRNLVAEHSLQRHIELVGLQDFGQMLRHYARCRAVVLASLQETAPMAVIEAMAAGKAVVATAVGGVPGLIEDGRSGFLVDTGDTNALAERMTRVLQNRELAADMGRRGRELAQSFRAEVIAERYRELYYRVAQRALP